MAQIDYLDTYTPLSGPEMAVVDEKGDRVYVSNISSSSIALLDRDKDSGFLSFSEEYFDGADTFELGTIDGLGGVQGMAISYDGANLYAVGSFEDKIAGFAIDATFGTLTFLQSIANGLAAPGLSGPLRVAIHPSDKFVFVACTLTSAVIWFRRDLVTGLLTYIGGIFDGSGGVSGIGGAGDLAFSKFGEHLYVTGSTSNSIAAFEVDPMTGMPDQIDIVFDGGDGVDYLAGPSGLSVFEDKVYVTSFPENALTVLNRNKNTGTLTFGQVFRDGISGVNGLAGAITPKVSPYGDWVTVTGFNDNGLAVFRRRSSGLVFREAHFNGVAGVTGLVGPVVGGWSPEGTHLYVPGNTSGEMPFFEAPPPFATLAATWGTAATLLELVATINL